MPTDLLPIKAAIMVEGQMKFENSSFKFEFQI